jgi:hypothetical protein
MSLATQTLELVDLQLYMTAMRRLFAAAASAQEDPAVLAAYLVISSNPTFDDLLASTTEAEMEEMISALSADEDFVEAFDVYSAALLLQL